MVGDWKTSVKFRDIVNSFDFNADEKQEVLRVKKLLVERLKKYPDIEHYTKRFNRVTTKEGFNKVLNELYDFCDMFRIWVEF